MKTFHKLLPRVQVALLLMDTGVDAALASLELLDLPGMAVLGTLRLAGGAGPACRHLLRPLRAGQGRLARAIRKLRRLCARLVDPPPQGRRNERETLTN